MSAKNMFISNEGRFARKTDGGLLILSKDDADYWNRRFGVNIYGVGASAPQPGNTINLHSRAYSVLPKDDTGKDNGLTRVKCDETAEVFSISNEDFFGMSHAEVSRLPEGTGVHVVWYFPEMVLIDCAMDGCDNAVMDHRFNVPVAGCIPDAICSGVHDWDVEVGT